MLLWQTAHARGPTHARPASEGRIELTELDATQLDGGARAGDARAHPVVKSRDMDSCNQIVPYSMD